MWATEAARVLHFAFAALWTGSVLFLAVGVLPAASGSYAFDRVLDRFVLVSRTSAAALLLTGGYLWTAAPVALAAYRGQLLVGMVVLWVLLAGLVEVGVARDDHRLLRAGAVVAAVLLLDAGLLLS